VPKAIKVETRGDRPRDEGPNEVPEVMRMPRSVGEIIDQAEELARRFESFEPDPADRARARSLAAVHRATLARAQAEATLAEAVARARADGHPWSAIGAMLGTSGEAARQRYGGLRDRRRRAI
jgi:hypothetical protein